LEDYGCDENQKEPRQQECRASSHRLL